MSSISMFCLADRRGNLEKTYLSDTIEGICKKFSLRKGRSLLQEIDLGNYKVVKVTILLPKRATALTHHEKATL